MAHRYISGAFCRKYAAARRFARHPKQQGGRLGDHTVTSAPARRAAPRMTRPEVSMKSLTPAAPPSRSIRRAPVAITVASVILGLAALLAPVHSAMASPQQAPNSRVVLDLPAGYQPSPLFAGFQNEELGVSFVILEVSLKAYDELAAGFSSTELAKRGLTDPETGTLGRSDSHIYMRARQRSPAGTYAKFVVLFRTADQTVLVSTNVPVAALEAETVKAEDIEKVLATARTVESTAVKDLYRLGYVGPFRQSGSFVGTSRLYTLDGVTDVDPADANRSALMVTPSLDRRPIDDREDLGKRLLAALSGYRDLKLRTARPFEAGGLPAIEIEGDALDTATGARVQIYQAMIYPQEGGYFRLLGFATAADAARLAPEFRRIAEGFVVTR
jgi:hypothetical protein